jgi:hypothetical protein
VNIFEVPTEDGKRSARIAARCRSGNCFVRCECWDGPDDPEDIEYADDDASEPASTTEKP